MRKSSSAITLVFFIVALIVVGFLVVGLYRIFRKIMKGQGSDISQTPIEEMEGKPITDGRLRKLADWKNYYLVGIKLIKESEYHYKLLIKYDWNNLARSLELYTRDQMLEEEKRRLAGERQTAFDQIVDVLDDTTAAEGEILDWEKDPQMQAISNTTESLLGLDGDRVLAQTRNAQAAIDLLVPQITQEGLNDLFRILDNLRMDIEMKQVMDIKMEGRMMTLRMPLYLAGRKEKGTIFRFDPEYTLRDLKSQMPFTQRIKKMFNKIEIWVMDSQMVAFPVGQRKRMIVIPLI